MAGQAIGLHLRFEALALMLCRQITFAAAAPLVRESRHRVATIGERYVELALAQADNGGHTHFVGAKNGPLLQIPGTGVIWKICKQVDRSPERPSVIDASY